MDVYVNGLASALIFAASLLAAHAWIAGLVACGLFWAAREARRSSGRWRWLAAAGAGWLGFGVALLWPRPEPSEAQLVALAGLLALGALSVVAVMRSSGFFTRDWSLAARVEAALVLALLTAFASFIAWNVAREGIFPWTDWSAPHAVLHVVNESGREIEVTWSWADDPGWMSGCKVPARASKLDQFLMLRSKDLHVPWTDKTFDLPAGFGKDVLIRAGSEDEVVAERLMHVRLDGHVLVRITREGRVLIANGDESWTGAPRFGEEIEAAPP